MDLQKQNRDLYKKVVIKMKGFLIRCLIGIAAGVIIIMSFFIALGSLGSDDTVYAEDYSDVSDGGSYGAGTSGVDGNSRDTYTYAGKTYIVYAQGDYAYNYVPYAGGNIGDSGCGPTSVAICVSAYDKSVTPETVVKRCESKYGNTVFPSISYLSPNGVFNKYLEEFGLTCTGYEVGSFSDEDANRIIEHLKKGQPIIFNYQGMLQLNAGNGFDSGPGHFVTLLGLDNNNNIYVGNPAWGCSGYTSMRLIKQTPIIKRYYLVTKK